ncbi:MULTISPECIES: hypothetical protein [unclassified Duganella]|uniref:hypothetical protein n=1 Tax=unclassified Duganella TaxID=2636909 RepID=UPI00087E85C7|nr:MULTISPECIES: hypothetical protein [unclassified Duganella]SDH07090.1 hypothetical protein SAMN05216320_109178 [Duganella sp. OV458]SDK19061.1 hypothetical protein SAMN05428973_109104 [Duganella sp. OV510]
MSKRNQWPQKADFKKLPHADAVALLNAFGTIRNLECLRTLGNFRHVSFISPRSFDMFDLYKALGYVVDVVNADLDDKRMEAFRKRLSASLGELDKPIAVTLIGRHCHNYIIEPMAWSQAHLR